MIDTTDVPPQLIAEWFTTMAKQGPEVRSLCFSEFTRAELEAVLSEAIDTLYFAVTGRTSPGDPRH